jgi:hypothetical protein
MSAGICHSLEVYSGQWAIQTSIARVLKVLALDTPSYLPQGLASSITTAVSMAVARQCNLDGCFYFITKPL